MNNSGGKRLRVKEPVSDGQATFVLTKGGTRPNSGRKSSESNGLSIRKVSLALSPDTWGFIDRHKLMRLNKYEGKGKKPTQSDLLQEIIDYAIQRGFFENVCT